jgi:hypothetical protein
MKDMQDVFKSVACPVLPPITDPHFGLATD